MRRLGVDRTNSPLRCNVPGSGCCALEPIDSGSGAGDGTRTRNLLITNQLLYQLSYASEETVDLKL